MSFQPLMVNPRQVVRPVVLALLLAVFSAASASVAYGQFTLSVSSPLAPSAISPGGTSVATLDIEPNGSDNPVSFTTIPCTVTPVQVTGTPTCLVSPDPSTPPAKPSLTVTTSSATPPGLYAIAVTGVSGSNSQTVTLTLTVVDVTEDYTLSVTPTTATPNPIFAGESATATVTVTPIGSYSGHQVTLACLSVSPIVVASPVCSFTPANATGPGPVQVTAGIPATATLTITTLGPTPVARLRYPRIFYALWLLFPGLALMQVGRAKARRKRLMGLLFLMALGGSLLLMPACGSNNNTNNPSGIVTPNNIYTFTLTGADENGAAPGNGTSCPVGATNCSQATVTLTVN